MSKTMLDKIGIIGDVKTAFNRLGIDTLAVVCVGGSSGTAVKVVTCDTVGGVYTDFLTLKADAENINEGFCFSLIGAKKFVKITGCDNAIGIVGDCDYDVKKVTFNTVTVAGADLDNNKTAIINVSTYSAPVEITPTAGKDGMKKATVTLDNIPSGGSATAYAWVDEDDNVQYFDFGTSPSSLEELSNKKMLESSVGEYTLTFLRVKALSGAVKDYTRISDTSFTYTIQPIPDFPAVTKTLTRNPTKDFTLWQLSE